MSQSRYFESIKIPCTKHFQSVFYLLQFLQAILLDDQPDNLKPAKELGMTTIQVKDPFSALKTLKEITGVDVSNKLPVVNTGSIAINLY